MYRLCGSSPLSRGILSDCLAEDVAARIIPALAGNTPRRATFSDFQPDHPRSRGEYQNAGLEPGERTGSSPLSRGIQRPSRNLPCLRRIIPALAGNTCCESGQIRIHKDHPRSRGEYICNLLFRGLDRGSSPLSRGIQHPPSGLRNRSRIIPALAGNTDRARQPIGRPPDHPRSRGEYVDGVDAGAGEFGSSPLSRGILCSGAQILSCGRIIPALAGNTARSTDLRAARRDHPRSRGEYCLAGLRISYPAGSSPLSRGIHAVLAAIKDC